MEKSIHNNQSRMLTATVPAEQKQTRIDSYLASHFSTYSRSFFAQLIDQQLITVNGAVITRQSQKVKALDAIAITLPLPQEAQDIKQQARELPIKVMYEHEHFLIIDKPAGVVVHKPNNHATDITLVDWLLATYTTISCVGYSNRPGIVHRLDKDTSGLMIIARTPFAHKTFEALFKQRAVHKTYLALVHGHPERSGSITLPIGRHPIVRTKMASFKEQDLTNPLIAQPIRAAHTDFKVLNYGDDQTLLSLTLHTGRTHQIRVHCSAIGHPIVGDTVYGKKSHQISRQALHAHAISFTFDNQNFSFTSELPEDFKKALPTF